MTEGIELNELHRKLLDSFPQIRKLNELDEIAELNLNGISDGPTFRYSAVIDRLEDFYKLEGRLLESKVAEEGKIREYPLDIGDSNLHKLLVMEYENPKVGISLNVMYRCKPINR